MTEALPPLAVRVQAETQGAVRALRAEQKKLLRLGVKLDADAAACAGAERLRQAGEVLKISLHRVPAGAQSLTLPVPWLPDTTVEVPLQRDLSPQQNLEKLFRRARGLAQGLRHVAERRALAVARQQRVAERLAQAAVLLQRAAAWDQGEPGAPQPRQLLREVRAWLTSLAPLRLRLALPEPPRAEPRRALPHGSLPDGVWQFHSPQGALVLAGRSAAGNDALVTRLLRGRDVWLHVRDRPGAHVVLRAQSARVVSSAELQACAILACHLSGVQAGEAGDVSVCAGSDVRKVKGAPAGSVYTARERVLRVTVLPEVVDGFYATRGAR